MATTQNAGGPDAAVLAEDEAGFKRGRGSMLWGLLLASALVLAGIWHLLSGGDETRVYGELGRKINGLRQAHFDQFWDCALAGKNLRDLKTNTELMEQLDGRAAHGGRAYGLHLREDCVGKLSDIEPTLDSLIIPNDLKADVEKLKAATGKLRSGSSAFISYLDNPELKYDSESAKIYLEHIARGWFDFRQAQVAINKTLKSKLEHGE
jgi:hypothetical protein